MPQSMHVGFMCMRISKIPLHEDFFFRKKEYSESTGGTVIFGVLRQSHGTLVLERYKIFNLHDVQSWNP